ncbi:hypothetical protein OEZ86_010874 [Tetradesmus obliquus]|nr:hypothetical protein OEZ86_010874 [Tetradesmus obliquus]
MLVDWVQVFGMPFGESLVDRVMEWVVEKVVLMALNNALSDTDSVIAQLKQAAGLLVGLQRQPRPAAEIKVSNTFLKLTNGFVSSRKVYIEGDGDDLEVRKGTIFDRHWAFTAP